MLKERHWPKGTAKPGRAILLCVFPLSPQCVNLARPFLRGQQQTKLAAQAKCSAECHGQFQYSHGFKLALSRTAAQSFSSVPVPELEIPPIPPTRVLRHCCFIVSLSRLGWLYLIGFPTRMLADVRSRQSEARIPKTSIRPSCPAVLSAPASFSTNS